MVNYLIQIVIYLIMEAKVTKIMQDAFIMKVLNLWIQFYKIYENKLNNVIVYKDFKYFICFII